MGKNANNFYHRKKAWYSYFAGIVVFNTLSIWTKIIHKVFLLSMASFEIIEIDTAKYSEEEVSQIISERSLDFWKGGLNENWVKT